MMKAGFAMRFSACLVMSFFLAPPAMAMHETFGFQPSSGSLLAHCGIDHGSMTAAATTVNPEESHKKGDVASKSLWGSLILSMAYQQDTELRSMIKKLNGVDIFTLTSVTLLSGLSLAQGIETLRTLQDDPHPIHPPVMGIIASGTSLVTLLTRGVLTHHYSQKIHARQLAIKAQVDEVLSQLKSGVAFSTIQPTLATLIGEEATAEFEGLWESAHTVP